MLLWQIIWIIIVFQVAGLVCIVGLMSLAGKPLSGVEGFEFVNPLWWYRNYSVNPFGAAMAAFGFTILCPIGAVSYWFYKLCTVGGKRK
jgi:hypothetical protein